MIRFLYLSSNGSGLSYIELVETVDRMSKSAGSVSARQLIVMVKQPVSAMYGAVPGQLRLLVAGVRRLTNQ